MKASRCLICGHDDPTKPSSKKSGSWNVKGSLLRKQINVIFVLGELLEIPRKSLEKCFHVSNGENPADWFDICEGGCQILVEKAESIFKEFCKARKRLNECRSELRNRIRVSFAQISHVENGLLETVWDSVVNTAENLVAVESCDVTSGDQIATQLLEFKLANQSRSSSTKELPLLDPKEEFDDVSLTAMEDDFDLGSVLPVSPKLEPHVSELENESDDEVPMEASVTKTRTKVQNKCPHCTKCWKTANGLKRHINTGNCRGNKTYPCNQCDKTFDSSSRLQSHKFEKHAKRKIVQCPHCQFSTDRTNHLNRHIRIMHEKSRVYPCEFCGKEYNLPENLRYHEASSHNKCSVKGCSQVCDSQADLWDHQVNSHGKEVNVFKCSDCGMLCKTKYFLRDHKASAHGKLDTSKEFRCNLCDKVCVSQKHLSSHTYNIHTYGNSVDKTKSGGVSSVAKKLVKIGDFICDICQTGFKGSQKMLHHQASVHNQCTVKDCRVLCKNKLELRDHQVTSHGKEINVFQCPDCPKLFLKWHWLTLHAAKIHDKKLEEELSESETGLILGI